MADHSAMLTEIEEAYEAGVRDGGAEVRALVERFLAALEAGEIRAASRGDAGAWSVNPAVKKGILVAFRNGTIAPMDTADGWPFADKDNLPVQRIALAERGSRIVPGGSSVRRGAYLGRSVTCMPPMYVNVGAWVGDGTMVDSHALVGSCAQIGERVHLSAAAQIGGVLEPIGQRPVIIEDDVLVGGGVGVYEGTLVRERAVLGAGVVLTASTPVYDLVEERVLKATGDAPLEIPAGAVVVPGTRPVGGSTWAATLGLQVACALIVKVRDERTDLRAALEGDLR
ncbi:MAG: 2,3,4,5-tetrahydropyridine-2,6-dicarboxylate N-succinyltransferase [Deltaproteobacteria bacterium]|nr:MAG: 2,3,4,5-tetrahydropyridine-2,6-dicarboxylate N-succinyltransferase [Deltaproteobacteria bacterium]